MCATRLPSRLRHPHDREIVRLAVPAFGALVAEPVFLLTDTAIVGHLGTAQLGALGIAGPLLATAVSVCVFLAYGTTAAVARRMGAGDLRGAVQHGIDGMWLALVLGALLASAGAVAGEALIGLFAASSEVAAHALTYLRWSLPGLPAMLVVLASTGVLRGLQDTRTPLVIAVVGALVNIGLNFLLVYGLDLGIAGSAIGTTITQLASAGAFVVVVLRGARRTGASARPDLRGIRSAASAGLALVVRTITLRVALVLMTYVAAAHGTVPVAAHQVAFTIWTLLSLALDAVAIAGQAIIGRNLGAGDLAGARAATRRMIEWGIGAGIVLGLIVVALRAAYVPIFTEDQAVRDLLAVVLIVVAISQPVCGVVFVLDGVLIGAGDARYLARAGVLTLVVFVPLALTVLHERAGLVALWWALTGFLVARLVTLVWRERTDAWLVPGAALPPGRRRLRGARRRPVEY